MRASHADVATEGLVGSTGHEGEPPVCVCRAGGRSFGLRLEEVSEIVPMAALSAPPGMPGIIEGLLNLAGTAVPVVRLTTLLGLPADPLELYTPLVVLKGVPIALLVSRVDAVTAVSAPVVEVEESNSFNSCVIGVVPVGEEAVYLIALDRLMLEKEQHIVADFRTRETNRLQALVQAGQ